MAKKPKVAIIEPELVQVNYGILSLDASTVKVGMATWINLSLESWTEIEPDWPRLDNFRGIIQEYCVQFASEGLKPCVVSEDIYLGLNPLVFKQLAILMGHIQAAVYSCNGEFHLVKANESMKAMTGRVSSPKKPIKRPERKALMVEYATRMTGVPVSEDEADAIGVGFVFVQKQKELVHLA